ncbi:MAG: hypothetical protein HGB05_09635 [Chloroflexi bacterium]|nr:hypothetical protein [Chloroflexota bacterium]
MRDAIGGVLVALVLIVFAVPPNAARERLASRPDQSELATPIVLYDGALGTGTPDTQSFFYLTQPLTNAQATQTFSHPLTILDTTPRRTDYAGYFAKPIGYAPLDRAHGYQVWFTTQVLSETHVSHDRAGFSALVIGSDLRGIELGFWENEVWAQEGGSLNPFTHAEGATFTTTNLIEYRLSVLGNHYTLIADGATVLSGPLRDYTQAPPPPLPINPYTTANLIFLGDDTSSAQAQIALRYAAVIDAPPFSVYLPLMSKS